MSILRQKLNEMALLLEDRKDGLMKRFVPEIIKKWSELYRNIGHELNISVTAIERDAPVIINAIMQYDPDPQKQYSTWMVQTFVRGQLKLEDLPRLREALMLYQTCKQTGNIPRSHDLMKIKNLEELYALVEPFKATKTNEIVDTRYERQMEKESKVVFETPRYEIRIPLTDLAKQWYGRNTEWCTAWGGEYGRHPTRNQQRYQGNLYIITDKSNGDMWQFHKESNQLKDVNDREVSRHSFVQAHPEVAKFFVEQDIKGTRVAEYNGYPVMDHEGVISCVSGVGLNVGNNIFTITYNANRQINDVDLNYEVYRKIKNDEDEHSIFCGLLNNLNLTRDNQKLLEIDIAKGPRSWSRLQDALPKFVENASHKIGYSKDASGDVYYYFFTKGEPSWDFYIWKSKKDFSLTNNRDFNVDLAEYDEITWLFLNKIKDSNFTFTPGSDTTGLFDGSPLYDKVLATYPGVLTIAEDYKGHGDTPRIRNRITRKYKEAHNYNADSLVGKWVGNEIMVIYFKNLKEAIEDLGNDTIKWASKSIDGGSFDFYNDETADDSTRDNFMKCLSPAAVKEVCAWFKVNYSSEYNEWIEEENTLNDITDLEDFINENSLHDNQFYSSMDGAYSDGCASGAESEVYSALRDAIGDSDLSFLVNKKWVTEIDYDVPCAIFLNLKEFMDLANNYGDDWSDIEISEDKKIEMDSPHYGWDGYDEKYANDRFLESLNENEIISDVTYKALTKR